MTVTVLTLVMYGLPVVASNRHSGSSGLLEWLVPHAAAETVPAVGEYKPLAAARILDTRNGTGTGGVIRPLAGGQSLNLTVLGVGGVPSTGVQAVALNVVSINATADTHMIVWPAGEARPAISTLNSSIQGAVNNLTMVKVGSNGQVSVYNGGGSTDVAATVVGYVTSPTTSSSGSTYVPLPGARILDSRKGTGGVSAPLGGGATVNVQVTGVGGVPASGVAAVTLNVGTVNATADSYLTLWPTGATQPTASTLNMLTEGPVQRLATVPVGTGGKISIYNNTGTTDVFGDVTGYFLDGNAPGAADIYVPVTGSRMLDTRNGTGAISGPLTSGQTVTLRVTGVAGVPSTRVSAVALNLASTGATETGQFTGWASGATRPAVTTLQARSGITQANLAFLPVGADGRVAFYFAGGSSHLIADVIGYFSDNNPPAAVDRRSMTPGDSADVGTVTPTLHSRYSDPDGDTGFVGYEVYNPATGALTASGNGPTVIGGSDSAWTVPAARLAAGSTYRWRSRGVDRNGAASAWSAYKYFNTQDASRTGEQKRFSFEDRDLNDRSQAKGNVANGNLLLHSTDLQIRGTGIDFTLDRYYNSRSVNVSALGKGWTLGVGHDVKLLPAGTNPTTSDVTFVAPSFYTARFSYDNTGGTPGWRHPPGVDADLSWNSGASQWELKFHKSEAKYVFNAAGRLLRLEDRNNNKITLGYDASGLLSTVTDTQNRASTLSYTNGRLSTVTDSTGRTLSYGYDAAGNLTTFTDAAGKQVRYRYNGDLVDQVTTVGNSITLITYLGDGTRRVKDFSTQYDPGNGVPTSAVTSFSYASGETKVTDPNGNNTTGDTTDGITTYRYDERDRVKKVIDALGHTQDKEYTGNDNISALTDALQKQVTLAWDPNDENLTSASLPTGAKSTFDYTGTAHPHSVSKSTDPQGNTLAYSYDAAGNETAKESSQYPGAKIEQKTYNSNGTVDYILDGNGTKTDFTYDAKGNLTFVDNPAPLGDITITPDALSRLQRIVDGKAQTTTYSYDPIDRQDVLTFHDASTVDRDYDPDGNLTKVTDATGITTFDYDKMNRQIRKTLPNATQVRYGYDHNGNLTNFSDTGGDVAYGYNQVNLLTSLLEPDAPSAVTFAYDNDNRRTKVTFPTSPQTVVDMTYDDSGRQKSIKAVAGTTTLSNFTYSYSKNGVDTALRQSMTDLSGTTSYGYDGLNRLTAATGAISRSYSYDIDFNRTSKTEAGTTTNYGYNGANQLTTVNGTSTFSYDGNGNLTGGGGWSLSYNAKNQTTATTKPGGTALSPMTYAGQDQTKRTLAGTTQYTTTALGVSSATEPDGIGTLAVGAEDGKPAKGSTDYYTRDNNGGLISLRTGGTRYYYLLDGLGSIVGLVNTAGTKVNTYSYDPYGIQTSASQTVPNPWRYASGQYDGQTSLTKFGTRYYNPDHARFTQRDPSGKDLPYAYAGCNPTNNTDPTGLDGLGCFGALLVATGATILFGVAIFSGPGAIAAWTAIGAGMTALGADVFVLKECFLD